MSQPKPKRQHYVPQWHLRRFRDPSAKTGQHYVAAYDRRSNTQHQRIAVTNVAVEADIYTLEEPGQADAYAIESQLAEIDERENKLVSRIIAGCSVPNEDIPSVRAMLESLHARTRDLHQRIKHEYRGSIQRQLGEQMEEEGPPPDWPDELRARFPEYIEVLKRGEWRVEHEKDDLLALQFRQDSAFPEGLAGFRGFTFVWLPDAAFVTSDNPIVARRHAHPQWGPIMDIGLANAFELWLPLDPHHALLVAHNAVACPTLIGLPVSQVRDINNALMRASDRWTIWQPGSAADQFLDLPETRAMRGRRR